MVSDQLLSVLLVEDNPGDALLLRDGLHRAANGQFHVTHVSRLTEALGTLSSSDRFDAIVLDLSLPDAEGLDLLGHVTGCAPGVPVVVLSGRDDDGLALRAVKEGAQDYLVKGDVNGSSVARAIRHAIERKRAEEQLTQLARLDALTGLHNRAAFDDALPRAMSRAARSGCPMALLFIDLDQFKAVNDGLGHGSGDETLRCVAKRLGEGVRRGDTVARIGGDEFAIILEGLSSPAAASTVARKLVHEAASPVMLDGVRLSVGLSIGVAFYPGTAEAPRELVRQADQAMYMAKEQGGSTYRVYSDGDSLGIDSRQSREQDLRLGLERGEFRVFYQPRVDAQTGAIHGAEALVRWAHPAHTEVLAPAEFLGLAEDTGLIVPLGEWVLRTACAQNKAWQDAGLPCIRVSVNLSGKQFGTAGLRHSVEDALASSGLSPRDLELELTETVLATEGSPAQRTLSEIRDMGVRISIDDFGTGYASLCHLRDLPIDTLKIDRIFVDNVTDNPADAAIVSSIIVMAHRLGLDVVAEGVETEAQRQFLLAQGCDEVQGFLVSHPVPADDLARLLRRHAPVALVAA